MDIRILGQGAVEFIEISTLVTTEMQGRTFHFTSDQEFKSLLSRSIGDAMKAYWCEILFRAFTAAGVTLIRGARWLGGVDRAIQDGNVLAFAASVRGYLESISDSNLALNSVPGFLLDNSSWLKPAVRGAATELSVCEELENNLIHFAYGRKLAKGEIAPDSHKAKTAKEYFQTLGSLSNRSQECYAWLCQITHPAVYSVAAFADYGQTSITIKADQDVSLIKGFCQDYKDILPGLVQAGLNLPLMTLKALNTVGVDDVYSKAADSIDLSNVKAWREMSTRWQG